MTGGTGGIGGLPPVPANICNPDEADCAVNHATTGWCLQATGNPVIVVTRWPCEPNDAQPTVTMIDPSTGDTIPNQVVVPCDSRDFEINHLCDFDPDTGEVIAAVTQIFEWNEATGQLDVRLVRADDPTGPPYVVQGFLRQCHVPTWVDVETSIVCGDTAGVRRQLTQMIVWDTRNGLLLAAFYLDAEGNVTPENPGEVFTTGDCFTPTLPAILDELEEANGHLADLNTEGDAQTALLTSIRDNADQVEPLLIALGSNTDGVEGLLTSIRDNADTVEPLLTAANVLLTAIRDNADNVEPLLIALGANTDQVEALLTAIGNNTDGIEGLLTAGNASTTTLAGAVKNEDAVPGASDAGIPALARRNDGAVVTTSSDGDYSHIAVDGAGRVGVTALGAPLAVTDAQLATANTHLSNISGFTDGIEGLLTSLVASTYLEDSAHATGTRGTFVLGVRNDGDVVRTDADGDYTPLSTDSAGRLKVITQAVASSVKTEDAAHVSGETGSFVLGVRNDADAVRTSADGDYSPVSVDSTGKVKVANSSGDALLSSILAALGGTGVSVYRSLNVQTAGQVIKGTSGRLLTIHATNLAGANRYLKIYNKATAPTNADVPVMTIPLEGPSNGNVVILAFDNGILFNLGIGIRCSTGVGDADNTNPAANDVLVNIGYQ